EQAAVEGELADLQRLVVGGRRVAGAAADEGDDLDLIAGLQGALGAARGGNDLEVDLDRDPPWVVAEARDALGDGDGGGQGIGLAVEEDVEHGRHSGSGGGEDCGHSSGYHWVHEGLSRARSDRPGNRSPLGEGTPEAEEREGRVNRGDVP